MMILSAIIMMTFAFLDFYVENLPHYSLVKHDLKEINTTITQVIHMIINFIIVVIHWHAMILMHVHV